MITDSTAIFASADILASIKFYKEVLAFDSSWTWGDSPDFGGVSLGGVSIMFCLQPELARKVTGHQHSFRVENTDEMYAVHFERGAKIVSEVEDKPWGVREYTVEDPSGYHLRFAGPLSASAPPSKPFPVGVTIQRRKPTVAEYLAIAGPESYRDEKAVRIFEMSWNGVVAIGPDGITIGTARVMNDAPGWFSIWDVAVREDWQGKHIGQRLMEEALAVIKEDSPGAWVHLFTYKHGFYDHLGFKKETVSMRRV